MIDIYNLLLATGVSLIGVGTSTRIREKYTLGSVIQVTGGIVLAFAIRIYLSG